MRFDRAGGSRFIAPSPNRAIHPYDILRWVIIWVTTSNIQIRLCPCGSASWNPPERLCPAEGGAQPALPSSCLHFAYIRGNYGVAKMTRSRWQLLNSGQMDAQRVETFESRSHCINGNEPVNAPSSGGGTAAKVGSLCLLSAQASSFNTLLLQWFSCSVSWERICSC